MLARLEQLRMPLEDAMPPAPPPPPPMAPPGGCGGGCVGGIVGGVFVPSLLFVLWMSGVFGKHGCPSPMAKKPKKAEPQAPAPAATVAAGEVEVAIEKA